LGAADLRFTRTSFLLRGMFILLPESTGLGGLFG
jgi:hypothetical protein